MASLPPHAAPATQVSTSTRGDGFPSMSLEAAMKEEVTHAARYEQQLAALERSLASGLKDTRKKLTTFKEKKLMLQDHIRLAKQFETKKVPALGRSASRTHEVMHEVEWKLPGIRSQLVEIRKVYDLGQRRAQTLQTEMEWKAKTDFQQWRSTLLGKSPLPTQQVKREWFRLLWRLLCVIIVLITLMYFLL